MEIRELENSGKSGANRTIIAACIALASLVVFLAIAGVFGGTPELAALDASESQFLRDTIPHKAIRTVGVITNLGGAPFQIVLGIAIAVWLWRRHERRLVAIWLSALAGNAILNRALKELFERGRPPPLHEWVTKASYAFPSAHSSGAVVTYGALAYLAIKLLPARFHIPCVVAALFVILTIGMSRMILQVHFLTDVTAGFASGTMWLATVLAVAGVVEHRRALRA